MSERIRRFIREIHRRSLWQVLGIYLVASWAVLGGVDTLGGVLGLPEWFPSFALALLIVGLPIVLATAFVQEGGPGREAGGVEVAGAASVAAPGSGLLTWRNALGGGVLAFALWGVVAAGWVLFGGATRELPSGNGTSVEPSVAVMPCTDLSAMGDPTPLTQGFAEGIISGLTQLPGLKVIGATSVIALLDENAEIDVIAETLDVAMVLECDLQQAGEIVRVRPRLVEVASGAVLWSEQIDRPADNIFAIQDQVARAVTDRLQLVFTGHEEATLVTQGTTVPEAHQAYLRGRYFFNQRTEEGLHAAISQFRGATELDPGYAEAYSGLADSHFLLDYYTEDTADYDFANNVREGLDAAGQAVSLAADLGMAHTSLALGLWTIGDWDGAQTEYQRAIALAPGYAEAHHWYAMLLYTTGRAAEAIGHAERAVELDPVSRVIAVDLGEALHVAGRMEDAIEQFRRTTELAPDWASGWLDLSAALLEMGEYDDGIEAWMNAPLPAGVEGEAWRQAFEAAIRYRETRDPQTFADFETSKNTLLWLNAHTGQPDRYMEVLEGVPPGWVAAAHWRSSYLLLDHPPYQRLLEETGITW